MEEKVEMRVNRQDASEAARVVEARLTAAKNIRYPTPSDLQTQDRLEGMHAILSHFNGFETGTRALDVLQGAMHTKRFLEGQEDNEVSDLIRSFSSRSS